ncbi:hypothetical protein [Limosilactobacillus mucosae]|uniref:hypothetical protein n=1 Tax=Limosilactobacillus mucosae TaxID=97478 RepID=UPI0022E16C64|nr:hypothetical protein [Limosilactobacillus mucosae]
MSASESASSSGSQSASKSVSISNSASRSHSVSTSASQSMSQSILNSGAIDSNSEAYLNDGNGKSLLDKAGNKRVNNSVNSKQAEKLPQLSGSDNLMNGILGMSALVAGTAVVLSRKQSKED